MTGSRELSQFFHSDSKVNFAMRQFAQISAQHSASVTMQAAELAKRMQQTEYPIQDVMNDWYFPLIWASEVTREQLLIAARRAHSHRSRWQKLRHPIKITPEKIAGVITQVGNVADNLRVLPVSNLDEIIAHGHELRSANHGRHSKKVERSLSQFARVMLGVEKTVSSASKPQRLISLATSLLGFE